MPRPQNRNWPSTTANAAPAATASTNATSVPDSAGPAMPMVNVAMT